MGIPSTSFACIERLILASNTPETISSASQRNWRGFGFPLLLTLLLFSGLCLYLYRCTSNPPGFFLDESSIAFNAYTISQNGKDEFGNSWPLYFRAFGDYKNPVQIYVLALLFRLTGPSILTARALSAIAGVLTAVLLGLLALRLAKTKDPKTEVVYLVGAIAMTTGFLTPWLFEVSRVVLEVAFFPCVLVLFLLLLHRASLKPTWSWTNVVSLGLSLGLLTYTYSIGRLLGPLLAIGLIIFISRKRWPGVLFTWAVYLIALVPLISFQRKHDAALTGRFDLVSYMKPGTSPLANLREFFRHFLLNIDPRHLFVNGDPNIYQVTHVQGKPVMLIATGILIAIGFVVVLKRYRHESWWLYILFATIASVIPASLTIEEFHMLRLVALPVFLIIMTIPASIWLLSQLSKSRVAILSCMVGLTLLQGIVFQVQYHASANSQWRRHLFDADYRTRIFDRALATGVSPIYLANPIDAPYIQAYWYGTLDQVPLKTFVKLAPDQAPKAGDLVISTEEKCIQTNFISQVDPYTLYVAQDRPRRGPLPGEAFRAEIVILNAQTRVHAGEEVKLRLLVRNESGVTWQGCERAAQNYQVSIGSHWLDQTGEHVINEGGRAPVPVDLAPGRSTTIDFSTAGPVNPGDYILKLDMMQLGVGWFSPSGSKTTRVDVRVE